jgi:hypothetical protein
VPERPIIFDSRSRDLICMILDLTVSETGGTPYLFESQTRRRQFRSGHFPGSTRNGYLLRLSEIGKTAYRSLYCMIASKAGS